jgi:hypothetical protein
MSIPIINLPIERIERHNNAQNDGYADDRCIDPQAAAAVLDTLGGQRLSKAPFYLPSEWSFATYAKSPLFNIAKAVPDDLASELGGAEAAAKAGKMPTSQWSSILRNAMAHGGIAYLNENGRSSYGEPVKMYAFVSGAFDDTDRRKLLHLYVLRISETNYRKFLRHRRTKGAETDNAQPNATAPRLDSTEIGPADWVLTLGVSPSAC